MKQVQKYTPVQFNAKQLESKSSDGPAVRRLPQRMSTETSRMRTAAKYKSKGK